VILSQFGDRGNVHCERFASATNIAPVTEFPISDDTLFMKCFRLYRSASLVRNTAHLNTALGAALALLFLFCTGATAEDQAAGCNAHPLASLPLYFAPDGAMATDVDVGAPRPLEFRIDLIGGDTELRDDVAAALHLHETGVNPTQTLYKLVGRSCIAPSFPTSD